MKGWISKAAKLAVYTRPSNKKVKFYRSFNRSSKAEMVEYDSKKLEVFAYRKGWLKVGRCKAVLGWLPIEEQCGNPYTTCN